MEAESSGEKRSLRERLGAKKHFPPELFSLDFTWSGPAPRAGQFFLIKPTRSGVFLGRPISVALFGDALYPGRPEPGDPGLLRFLIARRGRGTRELAEMHIGDEAELTGPLGRGWDEFYAPFRGSPVALVGGGIGTAPLNAFAAELDRGSFDFYAGFKTGFTGEAAAEALVGQGRARARELILAAEETGGDGKGEGSFRRGRIPGFLNPARYAAVFACGPEAMLRAVAASCGAAGTPCFMSLERRMACGVGACLGCTVQTTGGNRRCCADGPIFRAGELIFES
jgi:NAD(P)H-flavin reductase